MRLFLRTKKYPVLLRTRTCWKVLLQYYSVLQSTLQCYSVLQSTTFTKSCTGLEKWRLNFTRCCTSHETWRLTSPSAVPATKSDDGTYKCCTCHDKGHLNFTKCCAWHAKWFACLIQVTCATSFTVHGATSVTLQPQQILCLPGRKTRMLTPRHIWNVIYNARSNTCRDPPNTSKYCACHEKWHCKKFRENVGKQVKCHLQCGDDPSMIRP